MTKNNAAAQIENIISKNGHVALDQFFQISNECYYNNLDSIGKKGDFVTSPEISQLFGETIALSLYHKWKARNSEEFYLVEIGPGNGTLTNDILRSFQKLPDIWAAVAGIFLIETSDSLQKKQAETLSKYADKITWHNHLIEVPHNNCFIVCNEFFDALPFKQYKFLDNNFKETVLTNNGKFDFIDSNFTAEGSWNEGDIAEHSEVSLNYAKLINEKSANGTVLIVDYGYWEAPKASTLQAVKDNKKTDIFNHIGEADLTYHVDFESLAYSFDGRSLHFATQGEFLNINGIQALANNIVKKKTDLLKKITIDIQRLTSQNQMGSLFKVLEII